QGAARSQEPACPAQSAAAAIPAQARPRAPDTRVQFSVLPMISLPKTGIGRPHDQEPPNADPAAPTAAARSTILPPSMVLLLHRNRATLTTPSSLTLGRIGAAPTALTPSTR